MNGASQKKKKAKKDPDEAMIGCFVDELETNQTDSLWLQNFDAVTRQKLDDEPWYGEFEVDPWCGNGKLPYPLLLLQEKLKHGSKGDRYGEFVRAIKANTSITNIEIRAGIYNKLVVEGDDALWKELSALQRLDSMTLSFIDQIDLNGLSDVLSYFVKKNRSLTIKLKCDDPPTNVNELWMLIERFSNIEMFDYIDGCWLNTQDFVKSLVMALKKLPCLKTIRLSGHTCLMPFSADIMQILFGIPTMRKLQLEKIFIPECDETCDVLVGGLLKSNIEELCLRGCQLPHESLIRIMEQMASNKSVSSLILQDNFWFEAMNGFLKWHFPRYYLKSNQELPRMLCHTCELRHVSINPMQCEDVTMDECIHALSFNTSLESIELSGVFKDTKKFPCQTPRPSGILLVRKVPALLGRDRTSSSPATSAHQSVFRVSGTFHAKYYRSVLFRDPARTSDPREHFDGEEITAIVSLLTALVKMLEKNKTLKSLRLEEPEYTRKEYDFSRPTKRKEDSPVFLARCHSSCKKNFDATPIPHNLNPCIVMDVGVKHFQVGWDKRSSVQCRFLFQDFENGSNMIERVKAELLIKVRDDLDCFFSYLRNHPELVHL